MNTEHRPTTMTHEEMVGQWMQDPVFRAEYERIEREETVMLVQTRKAVLEGADWLNASDLAQLAGLSTLNPSAQPNKWKNKGLIFAINHGGTDYFPGYGMDRDGGFRPVKALSNIIKIFAGHKDAWDMAYWFCSNNSFLGGKRPQDLLASAPERVIEAARDEVQGIVHG